MNQKGLSITELLVAITIMAITLLGIAQLFPRGLGYTTQARLMSKATSLAQAKAEEMERLPKTDPDLTAGTHSETVEVFTRTWVITDNTPMTRMKRARIGVTWDTAPNVLDSVGVTVYLYKP
jgi:prepilin-type N-terminal cleavage/methylation domain-containing protein